eukprot:CAMPEP_0113943752 /NCGR_PEP_ID=MMETSP1339-20121228/27330_1 /TAXON_ID=94617 /ORGANISM="Fibrocapsa japonica" /LENGTH=354 /DNA_ID=CAMNT_0000948697 /DNA_START=47 /DNA_END=1111 /DNA_ORIENTATION=+ /assembly_acc=CAM_ASM_000762
MAEESQQQVESMNSVEAVDNAETHTQEGGDLDRFFREIDGPYLYRKNDVEPKITWKCSKIPVKQEFRLPIPITVGGTVVEYRFHTHENDISFALEYHTMDEEWIAQRAGEDWNNDDEADEDEEEGEDRGAAGGKGKAAGAGANGGQGARMVEEVILEAERYNSHIEAVAQQVQLDRPGTLVLIWDNRYSWFKEKLLSYSVDLHVPSVRGIERAKCERALAAFDACQDDLRAAQHEERVCEERKKQAAQKVAATRRDIERLSQQLADLTATLEGEMRLIGQQAQRANLRKRQLRGLTFRLLPLALLGRILAFADPKTDQWAVVCSDWHAVISGLEQEKQKTSEIAEAEAVPEAES